MNPAPGTPVTDPFALAGYKPSEEERLWAMLAHLGGLLGFSFLAPILALVVKGNTSRWVRAHAIESINFHLTALIVIAASFVGAMFVIGFCVLFPALIAVLVLGIIAAVKAWNGEAWRYPATIRFLKD
ncbi:MAG: DUF4870 domain-containing protein [Myxococcaceae bacterium]